jgi:hypothetical protein
MTAKAYLSQARKIMTKLKYMVELMRSLRDAVENITPVLSDMPQSDSPYNYKMEDAIIRVVDMENNIYNELNKLIDIHDSIKAVEDPNCYATLVKRYINGDDWTSISIDLGISIRRVYQIHGDALSDIDVIIAKKRGLH